MKVLVNIEETCFLLFLKSTLKTQEMHLFPLYGAFILFSLQMLRGIIKLYLKLCAEKLHKSRAGVQTGSATTESKLTSALLIFHGCCSPKRYRYGRKTKERLVRLTDLAFILDYIACQD